LARSEIPLSVLPSQLYELTFSKSIQVYEEIATMPDAARGFIERFQCRDRVGDYDQFSECFCPGVATKNKFLEMMVANLTQMLPSFSGAISLPR
jgi:hypothetical protein